MSTQAALTFLHDVSERPELQQRLAALGPTPTTGQLVELGREMRFAFSAAELQAAFRYDWMMRWVHHAPSPLSAARPRTGNDASPPGWTGT
jgi:Nif11 domain